MKRLKLRISTHGCFRYFLQDCEQSGREVRAPDHRRDLQDVQRLRLVLLLADGRHHQLAAAASQLQS